MKFILQENTKFILEERFILAEEDKPLTLNSLRDMIKELIDKSFNGDLYLNITNYFNDKPKRSKLANQNIEKTEEALFRQFEANQKDWTILQAKAKDFCKALHKAIDVIKQGAGPILKELPNVKTLISDLETVANSTIPADEKAKEGLITKLKDAFLKLKPVVDGAVTESMQLTEQEKQAIEDIQESQGQIAEIGTKIKDLDGRTVIKGPIMEALGNFYNILNANQLSPLKIEWDNEVYAEVEKAKNVNKACKELEEEVNFDAFTKSSAKEGRDDWAFKHEQAIQSGDPEIIGNFWDDYYSTVWGKDEPKVRDLAPSFEIELRELGFTESTNKFITFVKNNLDRLDLSHTNYPAIHNAYVDDAIKDTDLEKPDNNLISNPTLLHMGNYVILDYLKAQSILKKSIGSAVGNGRKYKNEETALAAVFTDGIDVSRGAIPSELNLSKIRKLRPLSGIKNVSKLITGESLNITDSSNKPEIKASDIWKDAQKGRTPDEAIAFAKLAISYIANEYNGKDGLNLAGYRKKYDLPELTTTNKTILKNYFTDYAKIKYPENLIKEIIKLAKIKEA